MRKYLLASTAGTAALALTAPAMAAGGYATVFGGMNSLDDQNARVIDISTGTDTTLINSVTAADGTWFTYSGYWTHIHLDLDYDTDNGFVVGAALGNDYGGGLSAEIELAYRKNDLNLGYMLTVYTYTYTFGHYYDTVASSTILPFYTGPYTFTPTTISETLSGDVTAMSIMANAWFEFMGGGAISPFIGAGIGWGKVDMEASDLSADDSGLAWQIGAGIGFDISDTTQVRLEYRYFTVEDIDLQVDGDSLDYDYEANSIIVGLKMSF